MNGKELSEELFTPHQKVFKGSGHKRLFPPDNGCDSVAEVFCFPPRFANTLSAKGHSFQDLALSKNIFPSPGLDQFAGPRPFPTFHANPVS